MQQGEAAGGPSEWTRANSILAALAVALLATCAAPTNPDLNGQVGGRVLLAPGVGLAHAKIEIDQVDLYDGKGEIRKHVASTETDDEGYFSAQPTGTVNGLLLIDASGGSFSELVTGTRIQLDTSSHLKALHWLGVFEDRSSNMFVTPVHALVEARFRFKMHELGDVTAAVADAYQHLNAHFGGLDWETVVPADLSLPATSPIDEIRAAFMLGGLALFADDVREASKLTPQVVNITTVLAAFEMDLSDQLLDGNDINSAATASGLQIGECEPAAPSCSATNAQCALSVCRPRCDLYVNSYRSDLAGDVSKFISSVPVWNKTGITAKDARAMLDGITRNTDPDLFAADACVETADRVPPTISWKTTYGGVPVGEDGLVSGALTVNIVAADDTDQVPKASFEAPFSDSDGDPSNNLAVAFIDTRFALGAADGELTVTAHARDSAGNEAVATRKFQVDNTAPEVALQSTGVVVDGQNVWWVSSDHPTLHGTVSDPNISKVEILLAGQVVGVATISGTSWTAEIEPGKLTGTDNILTVRATDSAGNVATRAQSVRLDITPPTVSVAASPVSDELSSTFQFVDDASGSRANHITHGTPIDLSAPSSCPTLHKFVHLLSQPGPNNTHSVLGSAGELNPISYNVVVSDDGVGIKPGTAEYRVGVQNGATINFLTAWLPLTGGVPQGASATRFTLSIYRDGTNGIANLGTTRGEYHVELRVRDLFDRSGTSSRCWQHEILAPPTRATNDLIGSNVTGTPATGRPDGLFSTKLNRTTSGDSEDFSAKFLNAGTAGGAVWVNKLKNYIDAPVILTVQVSKNTSASVARAFKVRTVLVDPVPSSTACGTQPCALGHAFPDYDSPVLNSTQNDLKFIVRLFDITGGARAEIATCGGCINDAASQTYQFRIPARGEVAGGAPHEYEVVTFLQTALPIGQGTNVTMAASDGVQPDTDPSLYSEFSLTAHEPNIDGSEIVTTTAAITGKLIGPPSSTLVCIEQEKDGGVFICTRKAHRQKYRALQSVTYALTTDSTVNTKYQSSATAQLPLGIGVVGSLVGNQPEATLITSESTLP